MNSKVLISKLQFAILLLCVGGLFSNQSWAMERNVSQQTDRVIWDNLKNPPAGYGEVAFYWWQGDTLRKERLLDQLNQLQDFHVSSLQINYAHDDYFDEKTGARPHYKTVPEVMSEDWWKLVKWFAEEAGKRGMSVSLSDYCLGIGQKSYFDEALKKYPEVAGYLLKCDSITVRDSLDWALPGNVVSLSAFPLDARGEIIPDSLRDLRNWIRDGKVGCRLRSDWKVYMVYAERQEWTYDPMHPCSGKGIIEFFYDEFDRHLPGQMGKNLNFFFSDELNFKLKGKVWNLSFADEFVRRKGYDICPELIALWRNIGKRTAKIRLDYNDVYVSLSEENYFKPIYDYNEKYGMTLGCDHGGRGYILDEFGDYFRTQRWNQGPGSDQPFLAKSIVKAKVAASIAHMYERPRVWLEGFYGSGWSTNTSALTDALYANLALGYNLLTLHGLYYTTFGRWWEWAPPCNHFRMPYWEHMKSFLTVSERLCYLLSQGKHVADVAVLYPVEAVVADPVGGKRSAGTAFAAGELLYKNGVDFDFMDYESLARAQIHEQRLEVGGEAFSVVVVPSMKAMKHQSLLKLAEFAENGGIVINIGEWPLATEKEGEADHVKEWVDKIKKHHGNVYGVEKHEDVLVVLDKVLVRDFRYGGSVSDKRFPYVHHRVMGARNVYAVYGADRGDTCFFRAKGTAELWDPVTAETYVLSRVEQTQEGTYVEMPLAKSEMQVIVFSPQGQEIGDKEFVYHTLPQVEIALGKEWTSGIVPVLDNKWGDYYLPASDEKVGAWIEQMSYIQSEARPAENEFWSMVNCSYGPQFCLAGPFQASKSPDELKDLLSEDGQWKEYRFSWRYGVEGDCGRQGYHGLKGKIHDEFIRLGELSVLPWSGTMVRKEEKTGRFYYLKTYVDVPYTGYYRVLTGNITPKGIYVDGEKCMMDKEIFLRRGIRQLVLEYEGACSAYFLLQKQKGMDGVTANVPLSMKWYGDNSLLKYSVVPEKKSIGWYRFVSAPGLDSLSFTVYGDDIQVYVGDKKCKKVKKLGVTSVGAGVYGCKMERTVRTPETVLVKVRHLWGHYGGAAWEGPVKQYCKSGVISVGDWSLVDGLKNYSGGIKYVKNIRLDNKYVGRLIELDLKSVVSTAEVFVNGKSLGVRLAGPWTFNLTDCLVEGDNRIEILVYNTLGNIYTTVPTVYKKERVSGLLEEPVLIIH